MFLDQTTRKIQLVLTAAKTTLDMTVLVDWVDLTPYTTIPGLTPSLSNGITLVDILAAPAASTQRKINGLTVYNKDTAAKTVQVILNDNGTSYIIIDCTLQVDDTLGYTDTGGWYTQDANGSRKVTNANFTNFTGNFIGGVNNNAIVGGTADAITLTPPLAITSYASSVNMRYMFTAAGTNTVSPPTIAISGLAALNTTMGTVALPVGGIISGQIYWALLESATSIRVAPFDSASVNGDTFNGTINTVGTSSALVINNVNNTTGQQINLAGSLTVDASSLSAMINQTTLTGGATTTFLRSLLLNNTFTPTIATLVNLRSFDNQATLNSGSSVTSLHINQATLILGASAIGGTISTVNVHTVSFLPNSSTTTNITSWNSYNVNNIANGALQTVTNAFSFRGQMIAGTGRWNLYNDGTAINYLNGALLIGSATDDTVNKLQVTGSIKATTLITASNGFSAGAPVTTTAATLTLTAATSFLISNNASATCTLTLPDPTLNTGKMITIKTGTAFTVVSATSNVVPLITAAAGTAILAATAGKWARIVSDGTNWIIMEAN